MSRIILALDNIGLESSRRLVGTLGDRAYAYKIHDLWDSEGARVVGTLKGDGAARVMVDLKLHDTRETVRFRAALVKEAGGDILTVHLAGEEEMIRDAISAGPAIAGITELTSLDEEQSNLQTGHPIKATVLHRARLAALLGVTHIVCSAQELPFLAKYKSIAGLQKITPGVRSADNKDMGGQKRVTTPEEAILNNAAFVVLGREVVKAENPLAAFTRVEENINRALEAAVATMAK